MTARARDPQDASGPTGGDVERVVRAAIKQWHVNDWNRPHSWADWIEDALVTRIVAALRVAPAASPVAWQEALFTYRARVYQYAPLEAAAELDAKYEAVLDAALAATPPAAPGPGR